MAHPHHLASPPFEIESFPSGFVIIVDRNGINWGLQEGGAVGFGSVEDALAWAKRHDLEMANG